jgi:hypothetical protein
MKILITCDHYPVASGRYAYNALKRLGHDVKSAGICHENNIWGVQVDEQYIWIPDNPESDWSPDLVIHMDPNRPPVKVDGALHVVYGVDNHVRDYWPEFEWDHLFLVHNFGHRMGEDNVTWLPCGYDPAWFTPGPPLSERSFDAAMVGYDYPQRAQLRYALMGHMPRLRMSYGLALYESYASAYQNAKISLVRSFDKDVAIRVWETAAMGCVLVMDETHDAELLGLVHGENCLMYATDEECAQRVKWVIENPDAAQEIAHAGQAWAVPSTWDARLSVIVDWTKTELLKAEKPKRARKRKVESGNDDTS